MRLKNKKTGEIVDLNEGMISDTYDGEKIEIRSVAKRDNEVYVYSSLAELNEEWEDAPEEPKKYRYVLPSRVRRAIISWVKAQDNPIEKISILLKSYYDTNTVDSDGFYDYEFYGYVGENNKNLVANTLSIRLKKPFYFEEYKDYTLPELGIVGIFGGEE